MSSSRPIFVALVFLAGMGSSFHTAFGQTSRTINRQFELDADGHVELDTFSGEMDVSGWDQNRVTVDARIEGDDAELVEKTVIRFDHRAGRLVVEADYDDVEDTQEFLGLFSIGDVDRPDVHFTVKMPRTASLTVDDFSSDILVTGLQADVSLDTFSSSIRLRDVEGSLDLETFSGSVEGENLRGRLRLETFSGDVRLVMTELTDDSRFETFSGDVELVLPADAGFELVGDDDSFGELSSEFALKSQDGRRISGEGGPEIAFESFSGSVELRKQ